MWEENLGYQAGVCQETIIVSCVRLIDGIRLIWGQGNTDFTVNTLHISHTQNHLGFSE